VVVRVPALVVATACVCALVGLGATAAVARTLAPGTLRVEYIRSSSLQFQDTNGNPIQSMPSGSYQVVVDDPDDSNPMFTMNGPGVSVSSNLNSSGMGIDRPAFFGPFNFQSGASYTASDTNIGSSSAISLSVTTGGSTSGGSGSGSGSSTVVTTPSSPPTGSKSASTLPATLRGMLAGSLSASGKPTLTFNGKTVKTMKPGIYKVKVVDHSKQAGFIIQKLGFHAMTLSAKTGVGTSSRNLTLSAGKWFFESSAGRGKTYFNVT
jgi:hypothetical protein